MPKYFSPSRFRLVADLARAYFPDLSARYRYRGKKRQIELFQDQQIPHPKTLLFDNPLQTKIFFRTSNERLDYPFVLKGDSGGGGSNVFCIHDSRMFLMRIDHLPANEPVLLQEWIDHGGMDLRVVIMGSRIKSYFRVGGGDFYNNVSKGARIAPDLFPEKQQKGREMALSLSRAVGIDIAGFDILFPVQGEPLFLEINFLFGRKGLGGLPGYRLLFDQAVQDWMQRLLVQG